MKTTNEASPGLARRRLARSVPLALAVVGVLLKDIIAKTVAERNLRDTTGLDAKISKLEVGLATPTAIMVGTGVGAAGAGAAGTWAGAAVGAAVGGPVGAVEGKRCRAPSCLC